MQNYFYNNIELYRKVANTVGIVGNIQRFCIHDGPGVRTVVFLKGCFLRCRWCSNPELQELNPEIVYSVDKCIHCHRCVSVCPANALKHKNNKIEVDREKCTMCGKCFAVCYAQALSQVGEEKTAGEVIDSVLKDQDIYDSSGGGITISGGEPTLQIDFTYALLWLAKFHNLSTAVETCGYSSWECLSRLLPVTDLFLFDLKQLDSSVHQKLTGVDNHIILENLKKLAKKEPQKVVVRIPVIPGLNYQEDDIQSMLRFALYHNLSEVNLLPYHELGTKKYYKLDRQYLLEKGQKISEERLSKWIEPYNDKLKIKIGG